jgi:hypothetical protein
MSLPALNIDWSRVFAPKRASAWYGLLRPLNFGLLSFPPIDFRQETRCWIALRCWRASAKKQDLDEQVKRQKAMPLPQFVPGAAGETAESHLPVVRNLLRDIR